MIWLAAIIISLVAGILLVYRAQTFTRMLAVALLVGVLLMLIGELGLLAGFFVWLIMAGFIVAAAVLCKGALIVFLD